MSTTLLRATCDERGMKRVAMIDDVFDTPDPARLDRGRYAAFRNAYNADAVLRAAVEKAAGSAPAELPILDEAGEDEIGPLWRATWRPGLMSRAMATARRDKLRGLFDGHGDGVVPMLDLVRKLLDLFKKELGREISVHGNDFDPDEVAKADVVLVDFFLRPRISKDEALALSTAAVGRIVSAARAANRRSPSFLLVSSLKHEVDIKAFQSKADLMKSRFRFFPKQELNSENVAELVSLHDLIDAAEQAETIEALLTDWRSGARNAVDKVHERMMELDISDLVYLDCFRLTREGVSVAAYLRWFLTAFLDARVTGELTKAVWAQAEGLKLFRVTDASGRLDPTTLVKTFDGPSAAIADAYGDILFDENRGSGPLAFPAELSKGDLAEGDLFVSPVGDDNLGLAGASVLLVMTPSCDLLTRGNGEPPNAGSVLLMPGVLKPIQESADKIVTKDTVDFLRLKERDEWRTFHCDWDLFDPRSVPWDTMVTEGPAPGFQRMGRIRSLYFHKIRARFANKLTRVGMEVPPLFPRPVGGSVHVRFMEGNKRKFQKVMEIAPADGLLWEIGPVSLVKVDGGTEDKLLHQGSRELALGLKQALEQVADEPAEMRRAADDSLAVLKDMSTFMDLMKPMKAGPRGKDNAIEFKNPAKPGDIDAKSASPIVVTPYKD